jgi:gamma-glutamylcyclotransferase (GGCT)/AIG2-like uncharacterized protein YtfP
MMPSTTSSVFVYGTLMPGHLRWGLLAPHAIDQRTAAVDGWLFDTGAGWPAARFAMPPVDSTLDVAAPGDHGPAGAIPGWYVEVASAALAHLLDQLDEVEGAVAPDHPSAGSADPRRTDGRPARYRRRIVATSAGAAWAYETLSVPTGWPRIDAWTDTFER